MGEFDDALVSCTPTFLTTFGETVIYQQYKAAPWVSPTSHDDPDGKWTGEANAYDEDEVDTMATNDGADYGHWLELLPTAPLYASGCRLYCQSQDTSHPIAVEVYYSDVGWTSVYVGPISAGAWLEIVFDGGTIEKARVKSTYEGVDLYLHEFDFDTTGRRSITAIVDREGLGQVDGLPHGATEELAIGVANDALTGISSDEIDCNKDQVTLARRIGQTAVTTTINKIISQDAGMMILRVL